MNTKTACRRHTLVLWLLVWALYSDQTRLLEQTQQDQQHQDLESSKPVSQNHTLIRSKSEFAAGPKTFQLADVPDKCQGLQRVAGRLVVVAVHKEDISWLVTDVDIPFLAYHSGGNATVRIHNNGAKEASAYLQFIAEYYDCLPEVTAFIHAHRKSWHSHDMVEDLHKLKWAAVKQLGYMPLHQDYFRPWGMYFGSHLEDPAQHLQTEMEQDDPEAGQEMINGRYYHQAETYRYTQSQEIAHAWQEFFGPAGLGPMPSDLQYYCCAQFTVTVDRIRRFPREFYLKAIRWAVDGSNYGDFSPFFKAVVMESLWHVIFGEPAFMPKASEKELCDHFRCDK